jgi:hypothetical protein
MEKQRPMGRKTWMALGLAVITMAAARAVDTDERHMIVPGERIGVIRLGMSVKEVHDAMTAWRATPLVTAKAGGPGAWQDDQAGAAIEGYHTDPLGHDRYGNTMKVFYVDNKVAQIAVQSVAYVTNKGGVSRLTSGEFRHLHSSLVPMPVRESWGGNVRAYDSQRQGLAVTYNVLANGREAMSAQEIFVHPTGTPLRLESPRHGLTTAPEAGTAKPATGDTTTPSGE